MKTKGLDRTKRLSRIPIQMASTLPPLEYIFLDYLLFRYGLTGYQIHISTMMEELNISKPTAIKLCKQYLQLGILNQDEGKYQHERLYHLNYKACESFIYSLMDGVKLVKPVDQPGKAGLPTLVKPVDQILVKPVDHTSIKKELKRNNIQVGQIPESIQPVETLQSEQTKPVTLKEKNPIISEFPENKIQDIESKATAFGPANAGVSLEKESIDSGMPSSPDWLNSLQDELKERHVTNYTSYAENIKARYK